MFRSRAMNAFFIVILMMLIAALAFLYIMNTQAKEQTDVENPTADQIVNDLTVETGEVTTNIKDNHFIKVSFSIQVSNKKARDELNKRSFQLKNAVIYTVSGMNAEDLQDQKGMRNLENLIKTRINEFLESGHVTRVYTTQKIVQ